MRILSTWLGLFTITCLFGCNGDAKQEMPRRVQANEKPPQIGPNVLPVQPVQAKAQVKAQAKAQVPAPRAPSGDPYDDNWRQYMYDVNNNPELQRLAKKADEAIQQLKIIDPELDCRDFGPSQLTIEIYNPRHLDADGRIRPDFLKLLRLAGVTQLTIGIPLSDKGMAQLDSLRCLARLWLGNAGLVVTDKGIGELKNLTGLTGIDITGPKKEPLTISGEGFQNLAGLSKLREINLRGVRVDDLGIAAISKIESIVILTLEGDAITDAGISQLGNLSNLMSLGLQGHKITGTGFKSVRPLLKLTGMYLYGCPINISGIKDIVSAAPNLDFIGFTSAEVADDSIPILASLRGLHFLRLGNATLTEKSFDQLCHFAELDSLDISNATIPEKGLEMLIAAPKLKRLFIKSKQFKPELIENYRKARPKVELSID
ncbi:leucine-rich repeat domain-containing protein [Limnoglobus roseus]|uniref:Leucine-rich repeat domain protein n=1 Tax=Limnoglobus roseus TaxID=2598579 RepID=A0A5C1AR15_9BACT|nr:hypothetical protein [Limnoglobus roseus]QEL19328.1 leucine-rich repeat domain protein [Limnoglobus roseus]